MSCPVCGYDPNPPMVMATDAELRHQRLVNFFNKNLQNTWWLKQPEEVCQWLDCKGVHPKRILDIGCGDGRWLPAIMKQWPEVGYVGIDKIAEHIEINKEAFPEFDWMHGDVSSISAGHFDTIFIMGTLNPKMEETAQDELFNSILKIAPSTIVCLFDSNTSGKPPDAYLHGLYKKTDVFHVSPHMQGQRQKNKVWLYERLS